MEKAKMKQLQHSAFTSPSLSPWARIQAKKVVAALEKKREAKTGAKEHTICLA